MVDINNPSSYKSCTEKQYEVWVCKPPIGTIVFNKLDHAQAIVKLKQISPKGLKCDKGYLWFAPPSKSDEVGMQTYNSLVSFIGQSKQGYIIGKEMPFVLCGVEGELRGISAAKLASSYFFLENGQPVAINDNIFKRRSDKAGNMTWYKVRARTKGVSNTMACFVPKAQKAQIQSSLGEILLVNNPSSIIGHGKGDFILCNKLPNGQPNLADRWVVNGEIFAKCYSNVGWGNCVVNVSSKEVPKPEELFTPVVGVEDSPLDKSLFCKKCDILIKELQNIYKFKVTSNTYEVVKDYRGIYDEVHIDGVSYVAKYKVEGDFKFSTKDGLVTANQTDIWLAISSEQRGRPINASLAPNIKDCYICTWEFPYRKDREGRYDAVILNAINCKLEAEYFRDSSADNDCFIDNRKEKESGNPLLRLKKLVESKKSTYYDIVCSYNEDDDRLEIDELIVCYVNKKFEFQGMIRNYKTNDINEAARTIILVSGTNYKGISSCFSYPTITKSVVDALQSYSGKSYKNLNHELKLGTLSFDSYILYQNIHDFLSKCRIQRHLPIFRGIQTPKEGITEGDTIPSKKFLSSTLSLKTASSFGCGIILQFDDVYGLHGFYLNNISFYRNREWEVLLDVGYEIKVEKYLYDCFEIPVYLCSLKKLDNIKEWTGEDYKGVLNTFILSLYNEVLSLPDIQKKCKIECTSNMLRLIFDEDISEIDSIVVRQKKKMLKRDYITLEKTKVGDYDFEIINEYEISSNSIPEIIGVIAGLIEKIPLSPKVNYLVIYNQLSSLFTENGFIIIKDDLSTDNYSLGRDTFKLTLSGDNDDNIVITFDVATKGDKLSLRVRARSEGKSLDKVREFDSIEEGVRSIYELVVSTFKLNCANRCDAVVSTIARYMKVSYDKQEVSVGEYIYKLKTTSITARLEGNGIIYEVGSECVLTNHFDNITKVASQVYSLIKSGSTDNPSVSEDIVLFNNMLSYSNYPYSIVSNEGVSLKVLFNKGDNSLSAKLIRNKRGSFTFWTSKQDGFTFSDLETGVSEMNKLVEKHLENAVQVRGSSEKKSKIDKMRKKILKELSRIKDSYDKLIWEDGTRRKVHLYEDEDINANTLYRLFLVAQDLLDCSIYYDVWDNYYSNEKEYKFSFDDENWVIAKEDDGEYGIIIGGEYIHGTFDCSDIDVLLSSFPQDIPYELQELYEYDFKHDFWFSMDVIYEFLESCVSEFESYGYLSEDACAELDALSSSRNSKVGIKSDFVEMIRKCKEDITDSDLLASLGDLANSFQL